MNQDEMKAHAADLSFQIVDSIGRHPENVAANRDNLTDTLVEVYGIGVKEGEVTPSVNAAPDSEDLTAELDKAKSILLSKTVWGAVIGAVAMFGPHVGIHIGSADQTKIASEIVGGIGTALTIYGRFTATTSLNLLGGK